MVTRDHWFVYFLIVDVKFMKVQRPYGGRKPPKFQKLKEHWCIWNEEGKEAELELEVYAVTQSCENLCAFVNLRFYLKSNVKCDLFCLF